MNKPVWIKFGVENETHTINLDNVIDIRFEKNTDKDSSVEIRYADRTYTIFKGGVNAMEAFYNKVVNGVSMVCSFYDCDNNPQVNGKLPNLDQCVLITENEENKTITKL